MANRQFATGVQRRQRDDQRGEHSCRLLGVAMVHEEAALVVDQQLVQLGDHTGAGTQPGGRALDDAIHHRGPVLARDANTISADLPSPAHGRVDQGFGAAAVGRTLGHRDELRGLRRQQRQRDRAGAIDLDQRQMKRAMACGVEVARCPDVLQDRGQCIVDRIHDRHSQTLQCDWGWARTTQRAPLIGRGTRPERPRPTSLAYRATPQSAAPKPLRTRSEIRTAMLRAGSNGRCSNPKEPYRARTSSSSGWVSTQKQPTSLDMRTAVASA